MLRVGYICNGNKCAKCSPECTHTFDYKYAKHKLFDNISDNFYVASIDRIEAGVVVTLFEKEGVK